MNKYKFQPVTYDFMNEFKFQPVTYDFMNEFKFQPVTYDFMNKFKFQPVTYDFMNKFKLQPVTYDFMNKFKFQPVTYDFMNKFKFQPVTYTQDNATVYVYWEGYFDDVSGIETYEVSLWKNSSCAVNADTQPIVDWIALTYNYTDYSFVDLQLEVRITYFLRGV
jgi:hypothetical protein